MRTSCGRTGASTSRDQATYSNATKQTPDPIGTATNWPVRTGSVNRREGIPLKPRNGLDSAKANMASVIRNERPSSTPLHWPAKLSQSVARVFASKTSGASAGSIDDNCDASAAKCAATLLKPRQTIRNTNNNRNPNRFLRQISQASAAEGEFIILGLFSLPMNPKEHRTSNAEHRMAARILVHFGVRCSMFDVRCFP